jgi:hypothetical protein
MEGVRAHRRAPRTTRTLRRAGGTARHRRGDREAQGGPWWNTGRAALTAQPRPLPRPAGNWRTPLTCALLPGLGPAPPPTARKECRACSAPGSRAREAGPTEPEWPSLSATTARRARRFKYRRLASRGQSAQGQGRHGRRWPMGGRAGSRLSRAGSSASGIRGTPAPHGAEETGGSGYLWWAGTAGRHRLENMRLCRRRESLCVLVRRLTAFCWAPGLESSQSAPRVSRPDIYLPECPAGGRAGRTPSPRVPRAQPDVELRLPECSARSLIWGLHLPEFLRRSLTAESVSQSAPRVACRQQPQPTNRPVFDARVSSLDRGRQRDGQPRDDLHAGLPGLRRVLCVHS